MTPEQASKLVRGTQVIYVPNHADGDIKHPDVERGQFIFAIGNTAFVRYYHQWKPIEEVDAKATNVADLELWRSSQ